MEYEDYMEKRNERNNINLLIAKEAYICKQCGKILCDPSERVPKYIKRCLHQHLKKHNITVNEYIIKHYFNNIPPKCICGCNKNVLIEKFKVLTFVADHQKYINKKHKYVRSNNSVISYVGIQEWAKKHGFPIQTLKNIVELYKFGKYPGSKLEKMYNTDWRTIRSYILKCKLMSEQDMKILAKQHQFKLKYEVQENRNKVRIQDNILQDMYENLLAAEKNKLYITIDKLRCQFNLQYSNFVIYNRLIQKYGKDNIDKLLSSGNSSIPETNFYFVLCFFFGKKNIKRQFKLQKKIYDFLLYDKILIEFDGQYWHKIRHPLDGNNNDQIKDQIALNNNYIIFRIGDKNANKFEIWNNLINLVKQIKEIKNEIS